MAGAVVFLAYPAGPHVGGAIVRLDGGQAQHSAPGRESTLMDATPPGTTFT